MVKNLIFDAGGVLIDLDITKIIGAFKTLGYPEAEQIIDPYKQSGIFLDLESGKIAPQQLYDYINSKATSPIAPQDIDNAFNSFLTGVARYKLELLRQLKTKYKVCLLSNTNAIMFPFVCSTYFAQEGMPIEAYFDELYLSYKMKICKPDKKIFQTMLAQGQMEASESIMIDDSQANLDTAAQLGMATRLIKPDDDLRIVLGDLLQ